MKVEIYLDYKSSSLQKLHAIAFENSKLLVWIKSGLQP